MKIHLVLSLVCLIAFTGFHAKKGNPKQPNIVWISIERQQTFLKNIVIPLLFLLHKTSLKAVIRGKACTPLLKNKRHILSTNWLVRLKHIVLRRQSIPSESADNHTLFRVAKSRQ